MDAAPPPRCGLRRDAAATGLLPLRDTLPRKACLHHAMRLAESPCVYPLQVAAAVAGSVDLNGHPRASP